MFLGLRSLIYKIHESDLEAAKNWYTNLLDKPPYFDQPFYVGFNLGGFELGLECVEEKLVPGNSIQTYWGVPNIEEAYARCLKLEATSESSVRAVGGDIKVATVRDPFGNILGLIENPEFKLQSLA